MADKKVNTSGIEISLDHWKTMADIRQWNEAATQMQFDALYKALAGMVTAWPYEGDPKDPKTYDQLHPSEFGAVLKAAGDAVRMFFLAQVGLS